MHELRLAGCRAEPLASYLKALGVLRLVAEQADPEVRGSWQNETFLVSSELDRAALIGFLAEAWRPTPILAAWNGGGGLFMRKGSKDPETDQVRFDKPTKMTAATDAIGQSRAARLEPLRQFVDLCRWAVGDRGLVTAPEQEEKRRLLATLRDNAGDEALAWLDAVMVLGEREARYPPLLGSGGNDGALDFGNNLHRRLAEIMDLDTGAATEASAAWLQSSLFGDPTPDLVSAAVGQYDPASAGGANRAEGFKANSSLVNPWDYVLAMEGALVLAGAATRRLQAAGGGALSFPFTVRTTGAGAASSADADASLSRAEIWLPLWPRLAAWNEVQRLFAEGRATVGRRPVVDAVDFARALGTLGVDRGITAFVRYGFLQRNGLAYFATPLGRWAVDRKPAFDLIDATLDRWIGRARRAASDAEAPATLRAAANRLARSLLDLGRSSEVPERVQEVLLALANVEAVCARSPSLRGKVRPVPPLSRKWLNHTDDGSAELRLARALAESDLRRRIVALESPLRRQWHATRDPGVVWHRGHLVDALVAVVQRQAVELSMTSRPSSPVGDGARPDDVQRFIDGDVDDAKLAGLAEALALVRPPEEGRDLNTPRPRSRLDPLWCMAALAWDQRHVGSEDEGSSRRVAGLIASGIRGDAGALSRAALRRLRVGGLRHDRQAGREMNRGSLLGPQYATPERTRRVIAALAFPLSDAALHALAAVVYQTETIELPSLETS